MRGQPSHQILTFVISFYGVDRKTQFLKQQLTQGKNFKNIEQAADTIRGKLFFYFWIRRAQFRVAQAGSHFEPFL